MVETISWTNDTFKSERLALRDRDEMVEEVFEIVISEKRTI